MKGLHDEILQSGGNAVRVSKQQRSIRFALRRINDGTRYFRPRRSRLIADLDRRMRHRQRIA
jgi:hypothetical protein